MPSLKEALKSDLTAAMKAGDNMLKSTLRMAIAAVMNAEVAGSEAVELSDDQVLKILQAETKKRLESAEIYTQAGRTEAAAQESAEAEILSRYLPAAMSDDELLVIVNEEVAAAVAAGNEGAKAMGLVVKAVRARAGSSADGAKIAALVKSALGMTSSTQGPDVAPVSSTMQRTVEALRRTMKAMYHVHPEHDSEDIASIAEQLEKEIVAAGTMGLGQPSLERHTRNPLNGAMNPMAPPMTFEYGEKSITAKVRFHEGYQGPPACVHGGIVAALLDDALGRTRHLTGRNCVTGSLNITYKRPTPLNADLLVNARIDEIHERKFIVSGEITYDGEVTASAVGVFVFLDTEKFNALVSDARSASR